MNVLIVFAHPEPRSFNGSMLETAVSTLTAQGHKVEVSDLYKMEFNPVGGRHDFHTSLSDERFSYEDEQSHAHAKSSFAADIKTEQGKIDRADFILFQFPLWWFSMPAIMKGWIDRVFAYGYAYGGGRWYDRGVFAGKLAMIAVTTGGVETAYSSNGLQGDIDGILFPIQHGILQFVGFSILPPFIAYSANYSDAVRRAAVLEDFRKRLEALESTKTLETSPVSEFDENLQRKR